MSNLIVRVIGYIFFRFLVFFTTISIIDKNVKWVKWSDLRNGEDWFMLAWLFFVPTVIEGIILVYPFSYGLSKIENAQNKLPYYLLFSVLFFIEFIVSHWFIGIKYPFFKVITSIVVFLILFRKRLFQFNVQIKGDEIAGR